jgi:predicted nucleic acid-binding protein
VTACYLDASALVKLATVEAESVRLRSHLDRYAARVTSRLSRVEVLRALLRRVPASDAATDAVNTMFDGLLIVELDESVVAVAAGLEPPALRSLDAIHLASALAMGDELDALVTYDRRLADAARGVGLTVVSPA